MARLRSVSVSDAGWTRRRSGRGFIYLDERGERLPDPSVERVKALVIPPAWRDVWICRYANGHVQATGIDAAGRLQYLYHPDWRVQRDRIKHEQVLRVARRLPEARLAVAEILASGARDLPYAAATAFRLLDLGYFRIGSDTYASSNGSYGLTTLRREHVRRHAGLLVFEFTAKSGITQSIQIADETVIEAVESLRRRRGGEVLLAYRQGRTWRDLTAAQVNEQLKVIVGRGVSAKDFRTWHGTVHAAVSLAGRTARSSTARKREISAAMKDVAEHLGNTPTVARASYVDPRVIEGYQAGRTIAAAVAKAERDASPDLRQDRIERAVLRLLRG
ncbi:MAG: DNA topoisomerase IB [Actinomycetota bacterium]|nr:DNA topoisomerase IB [Actinomycetota bacterium]